MKSQREPIGGLDFGITKWSSESDGVQLAAELIDRFEPFLPHIRMSIEGLIAQNHVDSEAVRAQLDTLLGLTPFGILEQEFVMLLECLKKIDPASSLYYWNLYVQQGGEGIENFAKQVKINRGLRRDSLTLRS
jgi:hypothetical protein